MEDDRQWSVSCRDITGKRRDMSVSIDEGTVVVTTPPGETAVLAPMEVGRLRAALRAAVVAAAHS